MTTRGHGWWNDPWELERYACNQCGELHCYWCGREFNLLPTKRSTWAGPSRDHVDAYIDEIGRRRRGDKTVVAHKVCNSTRNHDSWVPFHEKGVIPPSQAHGAAQAVDALERMYRKLRPSGWIEARS